MCAHAQQVALAATNENVHIWLVFPLFSPATLTAGGVRDGILAARGKQMVLNDPNWSDATTKSDSLQANCCGKLYRGIDLRFHFKLHLFQATEMTEAHSFARSLYKWTNSQLSPTCSRLFQPELIALSMLKQYDEQRPTGDWSKNYLRFASSSVAARKIKISQLFFFFFADLAIAAGWFKFHLPGFASSYPKAFLGLFTRRMHVMNPSEDSGNIPSGIACSQECAFRAAHLQAGHVSCSSAMMLRPPLFRV